MSKFHRTAISRDKLSVPMRELKKNDLLQGRMLDYGCGRGDDADTLGMEKYDPTGPFTETPKGHFQTITCIYVLNVIESPSDRRSVEDAIIELLAPGGRAYIAVRGDISGDGGTSARTWQGDVRPTRKWKMIREAKGRFRIYEYAKRANKKHGKCKVCK
jgi:hypothetical protein